ncbi:MAG: cytochrome P450 [Boseongicola sp. SB0677_bin_26]|nr:cytochrome P450 [Boseongicola sp. SB0665_bin_10]MYG24875.1 cytochrome P450 [Boseongicola sp. SB0677_bin_26]
MRSMRETARFLLAHAATAGERWRTGVAYNPLSTRMAQDPYPVYAAMHRLSPVHRSRLMNAWLFVRHADADAILRDHHHFGSDPRKGRLTRRQQAMLPPADEFTMLALDPPDHTRLRALVNKAFTSRAINGMEAHIRATAATLLDKVDAAQGFDLMAALAQPLPVTVVAGMLGVPAGDRDRFKLWSAQRARLLEPTVDRRERAVAMRVGGAFDGYFRPIMAQRRIEPRGDILSALVQAEDEGERLTERETLNMLRLLLIAGNETTTNLIGNGMLALLRNPDQLRRLREDPGLIPLAVEELMRYDPPAQATFRRTLADCAVNGFELRRGDNVVVLIGGANRDAQVFDDPERLDVGRATCPHLTLGRGIHFCLGAPLARLEGRIVLETLLERFPAIELLDDRPRFRNGVVLRGLKSLPLRCRRS